MKTNKSKLKLFLSCALIASGIEANALTPKLGSPMVAATNTIKVSAYPSCLAGVMNKCGNGDMAECTSLDNPKAKIISTLIQSEDDLNQVLDVNGKANVTMGAISGSLSGSYLNGKMDTGKRLTMYFLSQIGWDGSLKNVMSNTGVASDNIVSGDLQADFMKILKGQSLQGSMFFQTCGDSIVAKNKAGMVVISRIDVDFKTVEDKTKISGELTVAYKPAATPTDGVSAAINILSDNTNSNKVSKVSMSFTQYGGDPTKLAKILTMMPEDAKPGDPLPIQKCNMSTPEGIAACHFVQASVMKYVADQSEVDANGQTVPKVAGQLYDKGGNIDFKKLYYSQPKSAPYPGLKAPYELKSTTEKMMSQILQARRALENEQIAVEVIKGAYNTAGFMKGSDILTRLDNTKNVIAAQIATIDPLKEPYKKCFSAEPDPISCENGLNSSTKAIETVIGSKIYKDFKNLIEPVAMYRVVDMPMVVGKNSTGEPEIKWETCDLYRKNVNSSTYSLGCSGYPLNSGTLTQANLGGSVTVKETDAGINTVFSTPYQSCTEVQTSVTDKTLKRVCYAIKLENEDDPKGTAFVMGHEANAAGKQSKYGIGKPTDPFPGTSQHPIEVLSVYDKASASALVDELASLKEGKASLSTGE